MKLPRLVDRSMLNDMLAGFHLSQFPAADRFDIWRSILQPLYTVSLPDDAAHDDFDGAIAIDALADCTIVACASQPQILERNVATLRQNHWDHVLVQLNARGGVVGDCGSRLLCAEEGDINLVDLGRPIRMRAERFSHIALIAPRDRLSGDGNRSRHGQVFEKSQAISQVIATHMRSIVDHAARLTPAEANDALNALFLMISSSSLRSAAPAAQAAACASLRETACATIDRHLGDCTLDPARIAAACRMSRATLYRLFTADGGVTTYLLGRRLERAFDLLTGQAAEPIRISTVAHRCGFKSDVHFSRTFRSRFGMTPSETRDIAADDARLRPPPMFATPRNWTEAMRQYRAQLLS